MPQIAPTLTGTLQGSFVNWLTDLSGAAWTASAGTPASASGSTFGWTAPMSPGSVVRITVTSGSIVLVRDVTITDAVFQYKPSLAIAGEIDDITLIHKMADGSRRGRRKSPPRRNFEFVFKKRTPAEFAAVSAFVDQVGFFTPFILVEPGTLTVTAWYLDSKLEKTRLPSGAIDYSFRAEEA